MRGKPDQIEIYMRGLCVLIAPVLVSFLSIVTAVAYARTDVASPVLTKIIKPGQPIAIENSAHIPAPIVNVLRDCRVVCVGELHGSKEIPEFVGNLASQLSDDGADLIVGLELSSDNQEFIDGYMKTGDEEILKSMPIFNYTVQDGRGSVAMVDLLKRLRKMPGVRVVAFDPFSAKSPQDRDNRMAEYLAAQLHSTPNKRLLVLCGNVHAANCIGMSFDHTFCPMSNRLAQLRPGDRIYTIIAKFQDGITWSLTPTNKGEPVVHTRKPCSIECRAANCYFLPYKHATHGYNAELYIRTLNISEPYRFLRRPSESISVAFQKIRNNIYVDTELNNGVSGTFLVDTGCTMSAIDDRATKELNLKFVAEPEQGASSSKVVRIPLLK